MYIHSVVSKLHLLHIKKNTRKPPIGIIEKCRVMYINDDFSYTSDINELVGTVIYISSGGFANVEWDDGSHREELIYDLVRI